PPAKPPPTEAAESSAKTEESRWLAALSEPELDLLISLKMLAVKRAETAGRPHLADGVVLLEDFKARLEETSVDASVLDRLALSRDCVADAGGGSGDSEVLRRHGKDEPKPNSVKRERKQRQDGRHGETVKSKKKRKLSERR
uniref:Gamma-tubulin complex component n=1 Tax=Aegilops tauschii subsp. strangulata TaxID=200361 RepID=A0A453JH43_AEGTS